MRYKMGKTMDKMTKAELYERAKKRGVKDRSKMSKQELIRSLRKQKGGGNKYAIIVPLDKEWKDMNVDEKQKLFIKVNPQISSICKCVKSIVKAHQVTGNAIANKYIFTRKNKVEPHGGGGNEDNVWLYLELDGQEGETCLQVEMFTKIVVEDMNEKEMLTEAIIII